MLAKYANVPMHVRCINPCQGVPTHATSVPMCASSGVLSGCDRFASAQWRLTSDKICSCVSILVTKLHHDLLLCVRLHVGGRIQAVKRARGKVSKLDGCLKKRSCLTHQLLQTLDER